MNPILSDLFARLYFLPPCAILLIGLYLAIAAQNWLKRLAGLALFQAAIVLFLASAGAVFGGAAPILKPRETPYGRLYSNPLPQELALTGLIVGAATLIVGLAIAIRVREAYGDVETHQIETAEAADDSAEQAA